MKTRTLLLLALGCGIAILLAGGVLLVQLAGRDDIEPPEPLGLPVDVGDMTVTVEGSSESDGALTVAVVLGGVDDADGAAGFHLIASGRPASPDETGTTCGATTGAPTTCDLEFDVSSADGSSRVLFYTRGDDQARWELATP